MKKKLLILPLLACSLLLGSCNNGGNTPSPTPIPEPERYPTIDWDDADTISDGGVGGYLLEISINRVLTTGRSFECVFKSNHSTDKSITIKSSVEGVATIDRIEGDDQTFFVNALKYGDTILTIKDADGFLVYRYIIRVRDPFTEDNIVDGLYKIDKFISNPAYEAWFGDWAFTIVSTDPNVEGVIRGGDDYEQNVKITFTLTFDCYIEERDCYSFNAVTTSSTSNTKISSIQFTRYADWAFVYDGEGYALAQLVNPERAYF